MLFELSKGASPNVVNVRINAAKKKEWWFLLRGDAHHDNPHCDQVLEKQHLDEALERNAGILDCGDLHCAMGGKFDKRSDKSMIRPEHQTGDYFDALVRTAADFYQPYARNWIMFGLGNHETSVRSRHEICLTERLAQTLRDRTGAPCPVTGYTGWVRFLLQDGTRKGSITLWHMHGYGGGGPVTSDTIQAQRQRAYVEGADILWSGHTHDRYIKEDVKITLATNGEVRHKPLWYVKTGTYKDEYGSGVGGWHIQTGKPPKPLGAWWLKMTYVRYGNSRVKILTEVLPTSRR